MPNSPPVTDVHPEAFPDQDEKEKALHLEQGENDADNRIVTQSDFDTLSTWQAIKRFKLACFYCAVAAFSAATDGYQININGNILANRGFVEQFATTQNSTGARILDASWIAGWSGIQSFGQLCGMVSIHFCSDRFGKKYSMFLLWVILALSVLTESLASHPWHWLIGKYLAGVGVGCLQTTIPPYIAELSPNRCRGAMLVSYSFWFSVGGFIGPLALRELNLNMPKNWRLPILTQWSQIGLMLICYIFLPETPWHYARHNNAGKGKKSLQKIFGGVKGYDVDKQWDSMVATLEAEAKQGEAYGKVSLIEVFQGANLRRTIASCIPLTLQQFTGLALIYTYSSYFFASAGQKDPFQTTMIVNSIKLLVILTAAYLSDRFGRRPIVLAASGLTFIGLIVIGTLGSFPINDKIGAVLILFACIWNVGSTSFGAMGWAYVAETASPRLRNKTASMGAGISVIFGIAFGVGIPYALNANYANLGLKTAWIFVGLSGPFIVGAWFLCPEVANRTPAELDELFETTRAWKFGGTVTKVQREAADAAEEQANRPVQ